MSDDVNCSLFVALTLLAERKRFATFGNISPDIPAASNSSLEETDENVLET